jgi:hypothetical protein
MTLLITADKNRYVMLHLLMLWVMSLWIKSQILNVVIIVIITIAVVPMEKHALKTACNCLNTNIYSCLETSGGRSSYIYLNVVLFFNTSVN